MREVHDDDGNRQPSDPLRRRVLNGSEQEDGHEQHNELEHLIHADVLGMAHFERSGRKDDGGDELIHLSSLEDEGCQQPTEGNNRGSEPYEAEVPQDTGIVVRDCRR